MMIKARVWPLSQYAEKHYHLEDHATCRAHPSDFKGNQYRIYYGCILYTREE